MEAFIYHGLELHLSEHFKERVRQRKIDVNLVHRVITYGAVRDGESGNKVVSLKIANGVKLCVVIGFGHGRITLVTAYENVYESRTAALEVA